MWPSGDGHPPHVLVAFRGLLGALVLAYALMLAACITE